jgi:hypothetical protein
MSVTPGEVSAVPYSAARVVLRCVASQLRELLEMGGPRLRPLRTVHGSREDALASL